MSFIAMLEKHISPFGTKVLWRWSNTQTSAIGNRPGRVEAKEAKEAKETANRTILIGPAISTQIEILEKGRAILSRNATIPGTVEPQVVAEQSH